MHTESTETLRLSQDGIWLANNREITHESTCKAFSRNIYRDDAGYFIQLGTETKRIQVEDTAYFVVGVNGSAEAGYQLLLSDQSTENLDPKTLKYSPGRLTCQILADRPGRKNLNPSKIQPEEAKFLRLPYIELLKMTKENKTEYYLEIQGIRIPLFKK